MHSTKIIPKVSEVVVGLFTDLKNAKDAICDLSRGGFDASQINVAYASASGVHEDISSVEHSVFWKLREHFKRDLYRQGADQVSGSAEEVHPHQNYPFTEVDLGTALSEIGVMPARISLIENEIRDGVILLVKAGNQSNRVKAEEIVEHNNGTIRTDTALEAALSR